MQPVCMCTLPIDERCAAEPRKLCRDSHKACLLAERQDALQEGEGGSTAIPSEILWHPLKGEAHQIEH